MTVLQYMQDNPWMTFFILLGSVAAIKHLLGGAVILLRGYPPEHVNVLGQFRGEDE